MGTQTVILCMRTGGGEGGASSPSACPAASPLAPSAPSAGAASSPSVAGCSADAAPSSAGAGCASAAGSAGAASASAAGASAGASVAPSAGASAGAASPSWSWPSALWVGHARCVLVQDWLSKKHACKILALQAPCSTLGIPLLCCSSSSTLALWSTSGAFCMAIGLCWGLLPARCRRVLHAHEQMGARRRQCGQRPAHRPGHFAGLLDLNRQLLHSKEQRRVGRFPCNRASGNPRHMFVNCMPRFLSVSAPGQHARIRPQLRALVPLRKLVTEDWASCSSSSWSKRSPSTSKPETTFSLINSKHR